MTVGSLLYHLLGVEIHMTRSVWPGRREAFVYAVYASSRGEDTALQLPYSIAKNEGILLCGPWLTGCGTGWMANRLTNRWSKGKEEG